MKIFRKSKQAKIETNTCGLLREVVNNEYVPVSITSAENLKPTVAHFHKKSTEIYWVLKGWLVVEINRNKRVELKKEDLLVVNPKEIHEVVESASSNRVIVINTPSWRKEDEFIKE